MENNNQNTDQAANEPIIDEAPKPPVFPTPTEKPSEDTARSRILVRILRFMVIAGGLIVVFILGLGISFSACFTIKGPPPPECGPVSFVSLILMPGASLFFLIPLSRKIK